MQTLPHSSNAFAPCHLEWWPSRWCEFMLWALALLAPFALWVSDLSQAAAAVLASAAFACGVRGAWQYRNSAIHAFDIPIGSAAIRLDGQPIMGLQVRWRGPLAFLSWRAQNGRLQRLVYWPDSLNHEMQRELRLAIMQRDLLTDTRTVAR